MDEAIDESDDTGSIWKDLGPLFGDPVGGDDGGPPLVAPRDDIKDLVDFLPVRQHLTIGHLAGRALFRHFEVVCHVHLHESLKELLCA